VLLSDHFHSSVAETQEEVMEALRGHLLEVQNRVGQNQVGAQLAAHKVAAGRLH
jgi:hypothetical protein